MLFGPARVRTGLDGYEIFALSVGSREIYTQHGLDPHVG